jgi:hypothetical protein
LSLTSKLHVPGVGAIEIRDTFAGATSGPFQSLPGFNGFHSFTR